MIRIENTIKSFCNGEQSLDELLAAIEHLIKYDGVKSELILSELDKEKYTVTLTPNIIDAIKCRIHPAPYTIDGQHIQLTEELDDTVDYDDTQNEIDTLNESSFEQKKKASSFDLEPESKCSSDKHRRIGDTATELVGLTLNDRYELVTYIGSGGMGVVYKAIDRKQLKAGFNNPNVAVKILNRALSTHKNGLQSLQQEIKRCQKLNHPNVIEVYGANQDGDITYLIMEYLCGQSLKDKIAATGSSGLAIGDALPIIRAMGMALAFAHENGIVHYDFKPSNVIITEDEQIKIIDFGIAKAIGVSKEGESDTGTEMAITPTYASPEMLERRAPDPRDDIYAFACTTYELLTGSHPFAGKRATEARAIGLLPKTPKGLSPTQWMALKQALDFDRYKRTINLMTMIEDITHHEALWPSNSIFIRGIAASIVLGVSVTGSYLGNAEQHLDGFLDLNASPMQDDVTPIAQVPSDSASASHFAETEPPTVTALSIRSAPPLPEPRTQHERGIQTAMRHSQTSSLPGKNTSGGRSIPNTANDSADFASIVELSRPTDTANDSGTHAHASIPSSTPGTGGPITSTDPTDDRREQNHQNDTEPSLALGSTAPSSLPPTISEPAHAMLSAGTGETSSLPKEQYPASESPQVVDAYQAESETEKRDQHVTKLATLHREIIINRNDFPVHASPSPSLLLHSISEGDAQAVQDALNSGVSADTLIISSGISALMLAARDGNTEIAQLLLRAKADINAQDKQRRTALLWAASKGHVKVVVQLLDYGAKADLKDNRGETALIQATWSGHEAVVQELVKKEAGINMRDKQGLTALTVAAIKGHTPIAETLLNAGADPSLGTGDGKTALMAATWNGHADVVRLLSERDCLINTTSADGWTALINAAWNGHATIVRDLVKAGANPTITDNNQMSAIHAAEIQGFRDVADFLKIIAEK